MKEKHALWVAAANGGRFSANTPQKLLALDRWNKVQTAERFGWTPQEHGAVPADELADMLTIIGIVDVKKNRSSSPSLSNGR